MATPDTYTIRLLAQLLDSTVTVLAPGPSTAETGSLTETFHATVTLAGSASATNVKLGTLTDAKFLAMWSSGTGVTFQTETSGTDISAYPCAFLAEVTDGMEMSEVWLSNDNSSSRTVELLAGE